ncbi:excisionase [Clostridioides sp. ZZV14-6150]|uniref:excisionase n=1 Tax=unclassified Clostridioides TaxID=2635829 RepID=UPI001D0F5759|nr:excisionase [Clostridioides sp. ZZV14-6150]MCC0724650.1 excisionase [Clostridioides sp. ZZV14-6104]MCC0733509.1 excisionase [Clostridioides sp. ZZV14-6009]MCC0750161.1 excisionase [Clostridioides sp. ZZV13-5731]
MKNVVPIHEKYMLSIEEASQYFHIGENKLRQIVNEQKGANWLFYNGKRLLIKREMFERVLDEIDTI